MSTNLTLYYPYLIVALITVQHYQSYGEMIGRCSGVNIAVSLKSENWNVSMFQRAFALYHDQVCSYEPTTDQNLITKCSMYFVTGSCY